MNQASKDTLDRIKALRRKMDSVQAELDSLSAELETLASNRADYYVLQDLSIHQIKSALHTCWLSAGGLTTMRQS